MVQWILIVFTSAIYFAHGSDDAPEYVRAGLDDIQRFPPYIRNKLLEEIAKRKIKSKKMHFLLKFDDVSKHMDRANDAQNETNVEDSANIIADDVFADEPTPVKEDKFDDENVKYRSNNVVKKNKEKINPDFIIIAPTKEGIPYKNSKRARKFKRKDVVVADIENLSTMKEDENFKRARKFKRKDVVVADIENLSTMKEDDPVLSKESESMEYNKPTAARSKNVVAKVRHACKRKSEDRRIPVNNGLFTSGVKNRLSETELDLAATNLEEQYKLSDGDAPDRFEEKTPATRNKMLLSDSLAKNAESPESPESSEPNTSQMKGSNQLQPEDQKQYFSDSMLIHDDKSRMDRQTQVIEEEEHYKSIEQLENQIATFTDKILKMLSNNSSGSVFDNDRTRSKEKKVLEGMAAICRVLQEMSKKVITSSLKTTTSTRKLTGVTAGTTPPTNDHLDIFESFYYGATHAVQHKLTRIAQFFFINNSGRR